MGRKNRLKEQRKLQKSKLVDKGTEYKSIPYTKEEREKKWNKIFMQLMHMEIDHVLTSDVKKNINDFVESGKEYHEEIELPEYSRIMIINFVNDKKKDKENCINLRFKKIRIENEGSDNPINELNELQEHMFDKI